MFVEDSTVVADVALGARQGLKNLQRFCTAQAEKLQSFGHIFISNLDQGFT